MRVLAVLVALVFVPAGVASGEIASVGKDLRAQLASAPSFEAKVALADQVIGVLAQTGHGDEARQILDGLIRQKADAHLIILKARTYLAFPPRDTEGAMKLLKGLLKTQPKNVEGLLEWASALRATNDCANALKTYDRILATDPKCVKALFGKAETYVTMGKFTDAAKAASDAVDIATSDPEAHYVLGRVYQRRTDEAFGQQRAASEYRRAVELAGSSTRYYAPLLVSQLMFSAGGSGLDTLVELKRKAPADSAVAFGEGLLLDADGKLSDAMAKFQGAVAVDYQNTWAHFAIGVLSSGSNLTEYFGQARAFKPVLRLPEMDRRRAVSEFSLVLFQDPAFPYHAQLEDYLSKQSAASGMQETPTPEQATAQKAWNSYSLKRWLRH